MKRVDADAGATSSVLDSPGTMSETERIDIEQLLESMEALPSMPAVALQIVRLAQEDEATVDDFAEVLMLDSALSGKLLKLANSSMYNPGTPVRTLPRAVMTLGLKSVKLLALSFSLTDSTPRESIGGPDLRVYWRRTITCAAAAHTFGSNACRRLVDEGFLCGLLSRMGQLALAVGFPERYAALSNGEHAWPTRDVERETFGFAGDEVGAQLLRSWELPELLCDTIEWMGDPQTELREGAAPETHELVKLMHVARCCEELVCGADRKSQMAQLNAAAEQHFGLSEEEVEDGLRELENRISETADMLDVEMRPIRMDEILREAGQQLLKESLNIATEMQHVERIATQLESSNRELRDKVTRDSLTGLANRRCFDQSLERCVGTRDAEDLDSGVALLMIDIDHFKSVNDELGHPAGDKVLRAVATSIASVIRAKDLAARYGGEEFSVIFASTNEDGMKIAAERIREAVESTQTDIGGRTVEVTVSIGGAFAPPGQLITNAWALVSAADQCLYASKHAGRNCCSFTALEPA
jgi:diguanylate cyclase (GGDEF)-like protein